MAGRAFYSIRASPRPMTLCKRTRSADNVGRSMTRKPHAPPASNRRSRRPTQAAYAAGLDVDHRRHHHRFGHVPHGARDRPKCAERRRLARRVALGRGFALLGSLCYAELATALPEEGGDYRFLTRAYGRPVGFLFAGASFGWCARLDRLAGVHLRRLCESGCADRPERAGALCRWGGRVALRRNMLGVVTGKWTQNFSRSRSSPGWWPWWSSALATQLWGDRSGAGGDGRGTGSDGLAAKASWATAMIYILYAYGGWNDMAYVSAEVRDPNRNIVRALCCWARPP